MGRRVVVRGRRVLTGVGEIVDGWVVVDGDRVVGVGEGPVPEGAGAPDGAYAVVVPGFVDLHNHGGGGASFAHGAQAARVVREAHLRQGTTTLVGSLVTAPVDELVLQVRALRPLVEAGELGGVHLEGPWLAERWCGAHPPELLADPDPHDVARLADAAGDGLVMVTLAPERPGALEAVRTLVGRGVQVAVGHTDATYDQTRAAIEAGATVATHLFNAMRPPHHREPGPSGALLEDGRVHVESVVDGAHLHPAVVRAVARAAGDRWVLVTDAMPAALAGDGRYALGRVEVDVVDGVARLADGRRDPREAPIAGSTLSLARAVRTAVGHGLPLPVAVRAATAAPAAAMGWDDVGRLEPGRRADLVGMDEELRVQAVMRAGRWVRR